MREHLLKFVVCVLAPLVVCRLFVANSPSDAAKIETKLLQGTWQVTSLEQDGERAPAFIVDHSYLEIEETNWLFSSPFRTEVVRAVIALQEQPKALDLIEYANGTRIVTRCIYELHGNTLRICRASNDDQERPVAFSGQAGYRLGIFKRKSA